MTVSHGRTYATYIYADDTLQGWLMQSRDAYRIMVYSGYGLLASVFVVCAFIMVLSSVMIVTCVDTVIQFNDYDACSWDVLAFFAPSFSALLFIGAFMFRRASKFDLALVVTSAGIVVCIFLEYVAGLAEYGNLSLLFILAMGYTISGRASQKTTWKPQKQFFALFLTVVLSISLYTWGPNYIETPPSHFDQEYLKLVPFLLRLVGELCILIAGMHFGRGAMEWISIKTR